MADADPNAKPNSGAAGAGGGDTPGGANAPGGGQGGGKSLLNDGGAPADGKPADGKPADGKPADGKPADGKPAEGKDGKPAEGAPEKYTDFTLPEGVTLDQDTVGKFTAFAKEKNLSQADAQALMDMATANVKKVGETLLAEQQTKWQEIRQGWVNSLKGHAEFGGEKFNETVEGAKRAFKRFGDDEFRAELDSFGFGDNAGLVRLLARVDKATREDRVVDGEEKNGGQKDDAASVLYPNQGKK